MGKLWYLWVPVHLIYVDCCDRSFLNRLKLANPSIFNCCEIFSLFQTLFFKFKVTNREGFRIVNICCHCVYYSTCILVMLNVLSTSLNVDFPGTVFKYHTFSSNTINLKFEATEIQLLFVLSHYFFRIIETCLTKCFNFVEFSGMFLFACLFLQGCYCG